MSSIGALILARNEQAILPRCISSLEGVCDLVIVVDTGSEDKTREIADLLGAQVIERPWVNFGHNRTEALELAAQLHPDIEYFLLLDADMTVRATGERGELTADAYYLPVFDGGPVYYLPALVSARRPWRFVGSTHEYLDYIGPDRAEFLEIVHHCDGSRRPNKQLEDVASLEAELAADPDNVRVVFYLANSYRDLGRIDEAIVLYRRRALMGGWQAEAEKAALQALRLEAGDLTPVGVPTLF